MTMKTVGISDYVVEKEAPVVSSPEPMDTISLTMHMRSMYEAAFFTHYKRCFPRVPENLDRYWSLVMHKRTFPVRRILRTIRRTLFDEPLVGVCRWLLLWSGNGDELHSEWGDDDWEW